MKLTPIVVIGTLLLISACATVEKNVSQTSPAEELENAVELPDAANGLEQVSRHVYENPAAGIGYHYTDGEMRADVFVYPLSDAQMKILLENGETALITDAYNGFRAELEYAARAGKYDSYAPLKEVFVSLAFNYTIDGGKMTAPFIVAIGEFNIMANERKFLSYAYLTEFNGYFIKIRTSNAPSSLFAQSAAGFMKNLLDQVYEADVRKPLVRISAEGSDVNAVRRPGESVPEFMLRGLKEIAGTSGGGGSSMQGAENK